MIASFLRKIVPERLRPIGYLTHLTRERTGCRVRAGSFAGLRYVSNSVGSAYLPKLLGIYERELSTQVASICSSKPTLIVDIGAAEGYYAIGLARLNLQARIIAFEMQPRGQSALREMARLNNVADRIEIRGKCEVPDLIAALVSTVAPVVVCDVEGYEEKLLDPQAIPALRRATVLVELHDFIIPGITARPLPTPPPHDPRPLLHRRSPKANSFQPAFCRTHDETEENRALAASQTKKVFVWTLYFRVTKKSPIAGRPSPWENTAILQAIQAGAGLLQLDIRHGTLPAPALRKGS